VYVGSIPTTSTNLIKGISMNSIWGCVEMDAASRDFKYNQYLQFHNDTGCSGKALSESNYQKIIDILNSDIEEHFLGR
jgi:hypothetical protein